MNKKPSQGLLALTWSVLERSCGDYTLDQITDEHMEVLSGIMLHHVYNLPMFECDVLMFRFGLSKQKIKPLEVIGKELGMTASETEELAGKAFRDLVDASWIDILKTLIDIEYSDKEQS